MSPRRPDVADHKEQAMSAPGQSVADIKSIRQRARQQLGDGAVTTNYGGKVEDAIALLNHAVATEIVCVLRTSFTRCARRDSPVRPPRRNSPSTPERRPSISTFWPSRSISSEASPTKGLRQI